jgi:hypothetical protein
LFAKSLTGKTQLQNRYARCTVIDDWRRQGARRQKAQNCL